MPTSKTDIFPRHFATSATFLIALVENSVGTASTKHFLTTTKQTSCFVVNTASRSLFLICLSHTSIQRLIRHASHLAFFHLSRHAIMSGF